MTRKPLFHYISSPKKRVLITKSWQPVVVEEDIPIVKEKLGKISPANPVQIVENRVVRGDGKIRWMQFVNRGFFDEDRKLTEIQSVGRDITERKEIEAEKERLISELQKALSQIKTLSGLLPICSNCKRIRNDQGYWDRIESYIGKHSNAEFTHGICPECAKKLYPDLSIYKE